MLNESVWIPVKLPGLNDYVKACRTNVYAANNMKRKYENLIGCYIIRLPKFEHPVAIDFVWTEENRRRDLDNVAFAKKFVLDALVKFGKLKDDNRKCVTAFTDSFRYDKEAGVAVTIKEVEYVH